MPVFSEGQIDTDSEILEEEPVSDIPKPEDSKGVPSEKVPPSDS